MATREQPRTSGYAAAPPLAAVRELASRHALLLIVALAAVVRFATLQVPAYWYDEYLTAVRLRHGFTGMLEAVSGGATPHLYFILAWGWQQVFGTGEIALRSLSVLLGTALIPVVYAAATALASRRAGLMAAALAATNPLLIWYSQEARTYPLLVLLAALSFLFFVYSLQGEEPRWLWAWALASGLALTTHYFALALIVPEALWLLFRARASRLDVVLSAGAVGVVGVGLLPLWAQQQGGIGWIGSLDRSERLLAVPQHFVAGLSVPWQALPELVGAGLIAAVAYALIRADRPTRRAVAVAGGVGLAGVLIAIVAAWVDRDYILSKNMIELWPPFAVAVAVALGARVVGAFGPAIVIALCVTGLALSTWNAATPEARRVNWDDVAQALGEPQSQRVIGAPGQLEGAPLSLYLDRGRIVKQGERIVASELVLLSLRPVRNYGIGPCYWGADCGGIAFGSSGPPFEPPRQFKLVREGSTPRVTYRIYRAKRPVRLPAPQPGAQNILLQQPG